MSSESAAPSLAWKLAEVQGKLHALRPDAEVKAGSYSYSYISESALLAMIRPLLAERHIAVLVSVVQQLSKEIEVVRRRGNESYTATITVSEVRVQFTFVDGENGEQFVVLGQGRAEDTGDKSVYKAITSACRYVWWKTFLVPSDDDDVNQSEALNEQPVAVVSVVDLEAPLEGLTAILSLCTLLEEEVPKQAGDGPGVSWYVLAKRAAWRDYQKPISELTEAESQELHERMSQQLPEFAVPVADQEAEAITEEAPY